MKLSIYATLFMTLLIASAGDGLARDIGHLHSLALEPQSGTLLMGTHQGLYESRDDGKSWEKMTLKGGVPGTDFMTMVVDPSNSKTIYAGGHDLAVIKSEDGGKTWRPAGKGLPTMDIHALAVDPTKPERLHAWAVDHGLYRSNDAGSTWYRINDGPTNPQVAALSSVPIPSGMGGIRLYAGTAAGLQWSFD